MVLYGAEEKTMQWKDFEPRPQFPKHEMTTTVLVKADMNPDGKYAGKTIILTEEGRLSLWDSQLRAVHDILASHDFKRDVKVIWRRTPPDSNRLLPFELTEQL